MQTFCNPGAFLLFTHPCYNSIRTTIVILPVHFTLLNINISEATAILINYAIIIDAVLWFLFSYRTVHVRSDILYLHIN